ncbi:hypothetical protein LTR56_002814 [Elasticomyces elasticus]|nr:hypothetical protein LTR56_002814 [Elasticomyces elasticus]KAK3666729.1 hypothetical protein LTR22_002316 [Elasticomyces elasticus]KAK4920429.1 hypothetical protein LTR49_012021 [Elasticomyces elasticus]KAK5759284.1 hypothetical protein LTS12_010607 [Elasticomyces elasticus]
MAQQVLHLPELLENILLCLPMKDLLFSQKVCKTWKGAVDTSPHIQEALFYTTDIHERTATSVAKAHAHSDNLCCCFACRHKYQLQVKLNPLFLTYTKGYGIKARNLGNLLYNNSLHPTSSCHRMLLGKPTRDTEISFEIQPDTLTSRQWEARAIPGQLVSVFGEYDRGSDLGLTKAKFKVGGTLGETMRLYEKVVEELREGHFKPVNTHHWRVVHIKVTGVV